MDKIIELLAVHAVEGVTGLMYALRNKLMYRFNKNETLEIFLKKQQNNLGKTKAVRLDWKSYILNMLLPVSL